MQIHHLLTAITQTIHAHLPALREVSTHAGRFDLKEIKRLATRLPAVKVTLMDVQAFQPVETEQWDVSLHLASFMLVSDRKGLPKEQAAINLIEALGLLIAEQRWGVTGVGQASRIKASNLFSTQLDREGLAIWGITWEQSMRLKDSIWVNGTMPKHLYIADEEPHFGKAERYEPLC